MSNNSDTPLVKKMEIIAMVKEVGSEGSRILEFIASTEAPDRSNDIIDVAGWNLSNYMGSIGKGSNPIFAWSHNYEVLPVGKTVSAVKDIRAKQLVIRVYFPTIAELCSDVSHPSDAALFADTVYNMYKNGMLNAVSVGFRGLEYSARDDESAKEKPMWERGIHFTKAELLEVSAVLVPCNQEALVTMRGIKSFNPEGLKAWEKIMSEEKPVNEIEGRIKALEDKMSQKAGSKFSASSREEIGKILDTMSTCHKAIKACHETLTKMIEVPGDDKEGTEATEEDTDSGVEKPKPNVDDGKKFDPATASLAEAVKIIGEAQ